MKNAVGWILVLLLSGCASTSEQTTAPSPGTEPSPSPSPVVASVAFCGSESDGGKYLEETHQMVPQTLGSFRLELLEALRKGDQAWIQENSFKTVTVCGKNLNAKQLPQALAKLDLPSVAQVIEAAAPGTEVCKPTGIGFANGELWVRYWDEVESPVIQAINVNCKRN